MGKVKILCFFREFPIQRGKLLAYTVQKQDTSLESLFPRQSTSLNWVEKFFMPVMKRISETDDSEFAAAVAASAYVVSTIEEISSVLQNTKLKTRKQEPLTIPRTGSMGKTSAKDGRASSFLRLTGSVAEEKRRRETSWGYRGSNAKADDWEKSQITKIRKQYEKMLTGIQAWEKEKKWREKQRMEAKQSKLEFRKSRNWKHYQSKLARIDQITGVAREQMEEKRKHEENVVKEKANKMRHTGNVPVKCFCF